MPTPTDDRRDLLTVIVWMWAAPGKRQELRNALEALVEPTSVEEGFINYDLHENLEDPDMFLLYENWESDAALEAHFATPHLTDFVARIPELLDQRGLNLNRCRRIA